MEQKFNNRLLMEEEDARALAGSQNMKRRKKSAFSYNLVNDACTAIKRVHHQPVHNSAPCDNRHISDTVLAGGLDEMGLPAGPWIREDEKVARLRLPKDSGCLRGLAICRF